MRSQTDSVYHVLNERFGKYESFKLTGVEYFWQQEQKQKRKTELEKKDFRKYIDEDFGIGNSIIKSMSNRITYIDFWASWCGPCRTEMPFSKKLRDEYSKKGINFVYISIDENANNWARVSKEMKLLDRDSYLFFDFKNAVTPREYNISSIPRYMVIAKNGKVISTDAPRPSNLIFVNCLMSY